MSARENLLVGLLTGVWAKNGEPDRGKSGTALIDAYQAEVLREAVGLVELHVDLGAPPERILTELRRMADTNTTQEPQ